MHLLIKELPDYIQNQLVSLIECTTERVSRSGVKKVGLLASPTTIQSKLYHKNISNANVLTLDTLEQKKTEGIIRSVIAGNAVDRKMLQRQVDKLLNNGAEVVILGCTELSCAAAENRFTETIDPVDEVINRLLAEKDAV